MDLHSYILECSKPKVFKIFHLECNESSYVFVFCKKWSLSTVGPPEITRHTALDCIPGSWWENEPINEPETLVTTNSIPFARARWTLQVIAKARHRGEYTGENKQTITGVGLGANDTLTTNLSPEVCLWNRLDHQVEQLLLILFPIEFLPFKVILSSNCLNLLELPKAFQIHGLFLFFIFFFYPTCRNPRIEEKFENHITTHKKQIL